MAVCERGSRAADVAGKLALVAIPPVTLGALRFGVAFVLLWSLARWLGVRMAPDRVTAPLGLLGAALAMLLQNLGLDRTAATNASLLQGAAMAGVAAVTLAGSGGMHAPGLGDALVLASTGCFAAFVVLGRRAFPRYGVLPVLAGMAAWGLVALLPAAAIEWWRVRPAMIGPGEAGLVIYLGAGCSALTYALWGYALRYLEAGRAASADACIPVVGVLTAVLVLDETPLPWHLLGGSLVIAGIWLAMSEPRPAVPITPPHPATAPARTPVVGRPPLTTGEALEVR